MMTMNYKLIEINNIKFDVEPTMDFYVPTIWTRDKYKADLKVAIRSWIIDMLLIEYAVQGVTELPDKMTVTQFKQPYDSEKGEVLAYDVDCDEAVAPISKVQYHISYPTELYALIPSDYINMNLSARQWMENYLQIELTEVH